MESTQDRQFITENLNDVVMIFNNFYYLTILNFKVRAYYTQVQDNITNTIKPMLYFRINDICKIFDKKWGDIYRDKNGQPNGLKKKVLQIQQRYTYEIEREFDGSNVENKGKYYCEDVIIMLCYEIDFTLQQIINDLIINIHFKNKTVEQQKLNDQLIKKTQRMVYKYADNYDDFVKQYESKEDAVKAIQDFQCFNDNLQKIVYKYRDSLQEKHRKKIVKQLEKRTHDDYQNYDEYEEYPFFYDTIKVVRNCIQSDLQEQQDAFGHKMQNSMLIYSYLYLFLIYDKMKQEIIDYYNQSPVGKFFDIKFVDQSMEEIEQQEFYGQEYKDTEIEYSKKIRDLNNKFFISQQYLLQQFPEEYTNIKVKKIVDKKDVIPEFLMGLYQLEEDDF